MKGNFLKSWRLVFVAITATGLAVGGLISTRSVARAAVTCPGSQCATVSDTSTHAAWNSEGAFAGGANQNGAGSCFDGSGRPIATALNGPGACEVDLLNVNVAASYWNTHNGGVAVKLFDNATDDFDVFIWQCVGACTNATNGTRGASVVASGTASNGNGPPVNSLPEESLNLPKPSGAYYIEVVPFATTASYNMTADFTASVPQGPPPPPPPGCVPNSACLRDVRASFDQIDTQGTLYGPTNPTPPPPLKSPFEPDTQIEPSIAVNPANPLNAVASFQQSRADAGASGGTGWATTIDGGQTWTTGNVPGLTKNDIAPCGLPAGVSCAGPWDRASDPVVAFGPNNIVYENSLVVNGDPDTTGTTDAGLTLNESLDGGLTWSKPVIFHLSSFITSQNLPALGHVFDDKNWFTVDTGTGGSHHLGRVYAVWDIANVHLYAYCDPVNLINSGDCMNPDNWTTAGLPAPSPTHNQGGFSETACRCIGATPVVLNDGSLMVVLNQFTPAQVTSQVEVTAVGAGAVAWPSALTFGPTVTIASEHSALVPYQRAGASFPQVAIDRSSGVTGKVYVAWADTNFRTDGVNDAVFASSDATTSQVWGPVTRINNGSTTDHLDSWNTMIGVSADGTLQAAYRQRDETGLAPYASYIFTYYQTSTNQGAKWSTPLKVDIPSTNDGYCAFSRSNCFLGDYNQLAVGGPYTYIVRDEAYASYPGEPYNNVSGDFSGCPTNPNGVNGFQCHTHQYTWVAVIGTKLRSADVPEAPLIGGLALTGVAAAGLVVAVRRRRNKRDLSETAR